MIDGNCLHDYGVRDPRDEDRRDNVEPGGITGRAVVLATSTVAASLLVREERPGAGHGEGAP